MKQRIIAIIGEAGSGKDTFANMLSDYTGYPMLVSCTTRPMRPGEVNGREHIFISPRRRQEMGVLTDVLAYTVYGGYEYWASQCQLHPDTTIYIIDEAGFEYFVDKHKDKYEFLAINIRREIKEGVDATRTARDKDRKTLPDEAFAFIVENNHSLQELSHKALDIAWKIKR